MLNHMTPDALRDWFAQAPSGPCIWISGEVIALEEHMEVVAFQFDHHLWPLRNPRQVFQFGRFLVDVAMQHWLTMPHITQYLYQPAYPALTRLYQRALKNHEGCRQAGFRPILNSDIESGGYYGCEKT